jgi:uroporphyrinogen-III synthase
LSGRTIVVTRPQDRADEMVNAITALGGEPYICPMVEVQLRPLGERDRKHLDALQRFEWLIFTSASAVATFYSSLKSNGNVSLPVSLRIMTVGKKTADSVCALGWRVDAVAEHASAEGVVATLLRHGVGYGTKVLFPRALDGREFIPQELEKIGAKAVVLPVYQTVPVIPENLGGLQARLREKKIDAITFTSPSAVYQCFHLLRVEAWPMLREICVAAIGRTTAAAVAEYGLHVSIIPKATSAVEMIEAIAEYFKIGEAKFVAASTK